MAQDTSPRAPDPANAEVAADGADPDGLPGSVLDEATDALLRVSRILVGVAAQSVAATEAHITLPQYRALVVLAAGPQNVGTLAETLGVHPTTLTRLCDRLVAKGWIDRATSEENRREVTLALTGKGTALVGSETRRRRRAIREMVAKLDRETQSEIADALGALARVAEGVTTQAWRLGWTA